MTILPLLWTALAMATPSVPAPVPDTLVLRNASDCEAPLAWRIEGVDDRFGLGPAEAEALVREAAGLWEAAAGRPLFEHDPEDGFPISFVFDTRHQIMQDRLAREASLAESSGSIQERRQTLDAMREEMRVRREVHAQRMTTLRARQDEHQAALRSWEARGGPPAAEARELDRIRDELERERRQINEEADAIETLIDRVNAETEALNEAISGYNRTQAELRSDGEGVLTGFYRESTRAIGSWILSTNRQIEIYQFDDPDHLIRAVAHELGHALGLGTSPEPSAIMYEHARSVRAGQRGMGGAQLHPSDVERVRSRCPLPSP